MDPIPPPASNQSARQPAWGLMLTMLLFAVSLATNCVQRERHAEELRSHGEELRKIKAMLMNRRE